MHPIDNKYVHYVKSSLMSTRLDQLVKLARSKGVIRPRDLNGTGIARQYLSIASQQGLLERIGRGLYCLPNAIQNEHRSLIEVCKRMPSGVICLLSALQYHGLTTQLPYEVWVAVSPNTRTPSLDTVQIRVTRFSGQAFSEGIQTRTIEGAQLRVYHPAKTIADCFKYRNKVGLDVALEALRDGLRQKKATVDELVQYGRFCRVERVMTPYMEAIL